MGTLAKLKDKFTALTGAPATKRNAVIACAPGSLDGRRMMRIQDWVHALKNLPDPVPQSVINEILAEDVTPSNRLREGVKAEFTKITGLPAKKVFAEQCCTPGSLTGRRMSSTADWEHALANIHKVMVVREQQEQPEHPTVKEEVTEPVPEPVEEESEESRIASAAELICTQAKPFAEVIAREEIKAGNYKKVARHLHPDISAFPKEAALRGMQILNNIKDEVENAKHRSNSEGDRYEDSEYCSDESCSTEGQDISDLY
ncbi:hypothetical protein [Moorena sp. SIO3A2]|uniref:hypothetical protein n=1 Tax=Moorena sp. SIO3A2 TaxID=2607841 RepID=UPI0013B88CD2|nr:hypothetical protein [Moorena sp. SIO3A2]NER90324.1 hypothetical protein [Moorena sp. SIO3A2]